MVTLVMQSLGCEVAALNTVHFSEIPNTDHHFLSVLHLILLKMGSEGHSFESAVSFVSPQ